ncbi:F0F1 ATP synthase subunit B [Helicobacter monodelphidis]|uniref:F0F1 ATP synthase subunit B n=1 Tax=Helicobacter sp. 15-1451 TaxID=2004995 RepID=UPI000DCE144B|nr:F0F1 ATP synthase subunit B [Helicobacter sp. 15-1451]RAX56932.1 F0F1 ATP synthase subunit B [Helicobacter sp. 15-1451]
MKRLLFILCSLLLLPVTAFAAGDGEKDIVERTLNFILFAGLLYYFVADPLKNFFKDRAKGIESELEKVQQKLKESKKAKENAENMLKLARENAETIVATARREATILRQKIEEGALSEIEIMNKQYEDAIEFERRRVEQAIVKEVLQELFESDALKLDKVAYSEILLKKVA